MPDRNFTQLTVGARFGCAIDDRDHLYCWGNELDDPTNAEVLTYSQISAGLDYMCGITTVGEIECWGQFDDQAEFPSESPPEGIFRAVASGGPHNTCAIDEAGTVHCWLHPGGMGDSDD